MNMSLWAPGNSPVLGFPTEWSELFLTSILKFRTQLVCSKSDRGRVSTLVLRRVKCRLKLRMPCNTCTVQFTIINCSNRYVCILFVWIHQLDIPHIDINSFLTVQTLARLQWDKASLLGRMEYAQWFQSHNLCYSPCEVRLGVMSSDICILSENSTFQRAVHVYLVHLKTR
jgi:hypothetical protein